MNAGGLPKETEAPIGIPASRQVIGLWALIASGCLFLLLLAAENSPLFGGGWAPYLASFEIYLLMLIVAVLTHLLVAPATARFLIRPKQGQGPRAQLSLPENDPDATVNFLLMLGSWGLLSMVTGFLILDLIHAPKGTTTGQQAINLILFVVLVVAPVEEYFFRVVLPDRVGILLGSVLLFGAYHAAIYTAQYGISVATAINIGFLMALGAGLYVIYDLRLPNGRRFGYGASTAVHAVYDLFAFGVLGSFSLGILSLAPPHL